VDAIPRVYHLLERYRGRVILAVALAVLACLLNLPTPLLIQRFVDDAVTGSASELPAYALGLLLVFAVQAALGLANACLLGGVGLAVVGDLRHRLYARLQRVGLSFYDKTPAGAIISRLTDDVAAVQELMTTQTLAVVTDLGTTVVVLGLLLYRSPLIFLTAAVVLPIYLLVFRRFTRQIRTGTAAVRAQLDTVFGHLKQKFDGILVVKAHAREEAEMDQFAAQINAAHQPRLQVERISATLANISTTLSGIGTALIFALGALEAIRGRMTPGEVVSAAALAALVFGPIARLSDVASAFERAAASIERIFEILDQDGDLPEPDVPLPIGQVRGLVEFDQVSFCYRPNQPVIRNLRLRVEPGMKVALVGPTGCGKTTLLNLLLRFYDPTWGEIRLDGIPLRRVALAELRREIGVVPQEAVIFRQSLADNIRYGAPEANDTQVEAAATAALLHGLAGQLPDGYATLVGEGGHKLSQGERQRVAIARAICKNPALVVLDEATSSLDVRSEMLIKAALANLLRDRTAFIIAHRLATVVDADRIVVIQKGQVVQVGAHSELLAQSGGLYRQLCLHQLGEPDGPRESRRPLVRLA
jgi:subfamily B ATP-binding cassette protein MsbA